MESRGYRKERGILRSWMPVPGNVSQNSPNGLSALYSRLFLFSNRGYTASCDLKAALPSDHCHFPISLPDHTSAKFADELLFKLTCIDFSVLIKPLTSLVLFRHKPETSLPCARVSSSLSLFPVST
jgi:hypothetical protein